MFLLMDTSAWSYSRVLNDEKILDIRPTLRVIRVGLTEEILKEFLSYHLDEFYSPQELYIVPLSQHDWEQDIKRYPTLGELDRADQTVLIVTLRDRNLLVTDDGDLFLEGQALGLDLFRLPTFFLKLARDNFLSKTAVYQCLRFWEEQGSYKNRDLTRWKIALQAIR